MRELPTSIAEIQGIKSETIVSDYLQVTFFGDNFAVIVGRIDKRETTPDGYQVARVLEALRQGGHVIRGWNYALYLEDVKCVVVDYELPRYRGEEDV